MIKPTIYKSVPVSEINSRRIDPITPTEKTKVIVILQKLTNLIKMKHS
jgi:hypothetical protein